MNYEINSKTFAIIPVSDRNSKIIEEKRNYNLNKTTFKIIEHSCEYFGVSYRSRLESSYRLIKTRYKVPIVIEEATRIIFIPVSVSEEKDNIWVSYNNIKEYYPSEIKKGATVLKFGNGFKMEVPVSFYSFNNQFLKAARLSAILSDRIIRNY